jgi:hypothetical protein
MHCSKIAVIPPPALRQGGGILFGLLLQPPAKPIPVYHPPAAQLYGRKIVPVAKL